MPFYFSILGVFYGLQIIVYSFLTVPGGNGVNLVNVGVESVPFILEWF